MLPVNRGPAGRRLSSSAAAHGSRQRKGRTAQGSWLMLGWELKMQGMVLFPSSLFLSFFTPRVFLVLLCLLLALPSGRIPIWPSLYGGRAETQIQKSVALLKVRRQNTPLSQGLSAKPPLPMHVFFLPLSYGHVCKPHAFRSHPWVCGACVLLLAHLLHGLGPGSDRDGWFGRGRGLASVCCLCSCNLQ